MNKKLICYFSATGTTKQSAISLANIIKGDLFEIEPVELYTDEDLNWNDKNSRTTLESKDDAFRPSVKNKVNNISEYKEIYIGFPVWWYKEPNIIDTFIDENNLEDKNIHIFITSGSSSVFSSLEHLKKLYPNLNFVDAKKLNTVNESDLSEWKD